jgi:hypothetical protein
MRFSEEELDQIYRYIADRMIAEGSLVKGTPFVNPATIPVGDSKKEFKGAFSMENQERPKPDPYKEDAGGHIPEAVLRVPSYNELREHGMDLKGEERIGGRKV